MSLGISAAVQRLPSNRRAGDGYSVLGMSPKLAFDFDSEYYRTNGGQKSFSNAMTFARAGLATMVDSDGLIKWAPHNYCRNSEDPTQSNFIKSNVTVSAAGSVEAPDGTVGVHTLSFAGAAGDNVYITDGGNDIKGGVAGTFAVFAKAVSSSTTIRMRVWDNDTGAQYADKSVTTSEWTLLSHEATTGSASTTTNFAIYNNSSGDAADIYVWGFHIYRSDLGGMVNNPDRGDSYVPTTSSAVYLPRRGHHKYNGDQWVNKGILVESEARTNVVTYSDQFNNAAWTKAAPTITADAIASPDGNDNADKLVESSTTAHAVYQVPTVTAVAYTFSVFAKSAERTQVNLDFTGGTNGAYFNLSTGEVISSSGTGLTAAITPMGNDWYRCSITQVQSAGAIYPSVSTSVGGARVYLGDGSSGIYIYGAQLEAGSTPSSYIPTSGSTVTRAAETVTVPYANLPWPTPTYIGDELVTNGTFDTDISGWTGVNAVLSSVAGVLRVSDNGVYTTAYQAISTVIGNVYKVTFDFVGSDGFGYNYGYGNTIPDGATYYAENTFNSSDTIAKTVSYEFVASSTTTYIIFGSQGTYYSEYDNISVREINPLSVSIAMMGEMNYADNSDALEVVHLRWEKDTQNKLMHYVSTHVGALDYLEGTQAFQQAASNIFDTLYDTPQTYSAGLNVPFNISGRHGSTFINGAVDGTALTANTTPVALPDLSTTNLNLAYDFMGTLSEFRIWDRDIGDTGIAEATA